MYATKEQRGFVLRVGLVHRQIHTGTATLVIPGDAVLRAELLEIFHDSPVGGHLSLYHMVNQLSHRYYWWGMYHDY